MSVLGGFELLNRALRNYKDDKARHEQTMLLGQLENAKLQDAINDPTIKLQRAQAKWQNEEVDVELGLPNTAAMTLDQRMNYNKYSRPAIQRIIGTGQELNDDNQLVMTGTNTRIRKPRWEAEQLVNQVQIAAATSLLGTNQLEIDIADQTKKLEELNRDSQTYLDIGLDPKVKSLAIKTEEAKLKKLIVNRDDPEMRARNLMSDNNRISDVLRQHIQSGRPNKLLIESLDQMMARNNAEIKMYIDKGDVKGLKEYKYWAKDPATGGIVHVSKYADPREEQPAKILVGNQTYSLGDYKEAKGGGSDGDSVSSLTEPQKNTIAQAVTKARILLGQGHLDKMEMDQLEEMLISTGAALDDADAKFLANAIKNNSPNVIKAVEQLLHSYDKRYGHLDWYPKDEKQTVKSARTPDDVIAAALGVPDAPVSETPASQETKPESVPKPQTSPGPNQIREAIKPNPNEQAKYNQGLLNQNLDKANSLRKKIRDMEQGNISEGPRGLKLKMAQESLRQTLKEIEKIRSDIAMLENKPVDSTDIEKLKRAASINSQRNN